MTRTVTFRSFGDSLASSRYRAVIPQRALAAQGVAKGNDVLVIGKHGWNWDAEASAFKRVVFDVCDDHFDGTHGVHYRDACAKADAVTCNSLEMARRVKAVTGREAHVIPDPFEWPECRPRVHDDLLWFGHKSNLADVGPWVPRLSGRRVTLVSNVGGDSGVPGWAAVQWTPESMAREFQRAGMVIIPTGRSTCKSANRAIEAIRQGLWPVCGPLPAYADLGVWIGDIADGVEWALSNQDEVLKRIGKAQAYVRKAYAPSRIGMLWREVLTYV